MNNVTAVLEKNADHNITEVMAQDDSFSFYRSDRLALKQLLPLLNHKVVVKTLPLSMANIKNTAEVLLPQLTGRQDYHFTVSSHQAQPDKHLNGENPAMRIFMTLPPITQTEQSIAKSAPIKDSTLINMKIEIAPGQKLEWAQNLAITLPTQYVGHNQHVRLVQEFYLHAGASLKLYSLAPLIPTQHQEFKDNDSNLIDHSIKVYHMAKDSMSEVITRAVLAMQEKMMAQVRTEIHPHATNADATQDIKAILLSPTARFDGKPQLDIKHHKVKAKHGLAIGRLPEQQVYYLQARGIKKPLAEKLLLRGFFLNAVKNFSEPVINWLEQQIPITD